MYWCSRSGVCDGEWCLPDSPKPDSPKLGFRVRVRVRVRLGYGLGRGLGLAFRRIGFRRNGTEPGE